MIYHWLSAYICMIGLMIGQSISKSIHHWYIVDFLLYVCGIPLVYWYKNILTNHTCLYIYMCVSCYIICKWLRWTGYCKRPMCPIPKSGWCSINQWYAYVFAYVFAYVYIYICSCFIQYITGEYELSGFMIY